MMGNWFEKMKPIRIIVSEKTYDEFMAILERPARHLPNLAKLLNEKAVWDMTRSQLEKLAEKMDKKLSPTSGMEQAENDGAKWRVHSPGWSGGDFFEVLSQVEDYLTITCQGQEME